jgi:hypothetical protein
MNETGVTFSGIILIKDHLKIDELFRKLNYGAHAGCKMIPCTNFSYLEKEARRKFARLCLQFDPSAARA